MLKALVAVFLLFCVVDAAVVKITGANVDQLKNSPHFVKFFAPWCGHCKNMAADWERFSDKAPTGVTVAEVDCTLADSKSICESYGIRGYPTLKYIANGQQYTFNRQRNVDEFTNFITKSFYLQPEVEKKSLP